MVWHKRDRSAAQVPIKAVAIDELVDSGRLKKPTFIKIAVEGAEGLALTGMRRTITSARPVLFLECSDAGRETTWQMLRELGYRCRCALTGNSINEFDKYRHSDSLWLPQRD